MKIKALTSWNLEIHGVSIGNSTFAGAGHEDGVRR